MFHPFSLTRLLGSVGLLMGGAVFAQSPGKVTTALPLTDLSAFQKPSANWRIAGDVSAPLSQANSLSAQAGTGILANIPVKQEYGQAYNLLWATEHGDVDLELDYMMAKGSNSGVYLQGRYEVQLFDSWGVKAPKIVDNGSIYERWDESRPEGRKGYEGQSARQNASRAPGLWQNLKISFQAPRFDAAGRKTENARMLRVELNGVLIHENVALSGPTRAASFEDEKPTGPLMLQGDHGPVAFRNIKITTYDKFRPTLNNFITGRDPVDPILVEATTNTLLRSFMDLPGTPPTGVMGQTNRQAYRVTHAVSVGAPEGIHYTYDLDNGSVVQVWRGSFLDTTPMWDNRGDGSSRPTGMVQRFGRPALMLVPLASAQTAWPTDTTGSSYRPKGYNLDEQDRPTFRYQSFGAIVQDQLRVLDNNQGLRRELTVQNAPASFYARLISGDSIKPLENGLYIVDGHTYLRLDNTEGATPTVRTVGGKQELIVSVKTKLTYSILF
jgi:hypothetical protein